jgi:aryl-alcohol dehydrogenase-like predicted oxidoreductase
LGRTGVSVSKLCLGTMMFGAWGNPDHDDSVRIIHAALDAGVNFVDTADVYSAGESEEIVGKALKGRRDDVVLATKFWGPMGDDPNQRGVSRRWIVTEVENSLRRLQTDHIDLSQMHRPDPAARRPAHRPAPRHGHPHLPPAVRRLALGQLVGRQLADLTGPQAPGRPLRQEPARQPAQAGGRPAARAGRRGCRPAADRAGHRLRRQPPGRDLGIIGPRTMEQLESQLPAADAVLDAAILDRIDAIVAPGVTVNPADTSYGEQVLQPQLRRR